MRVLVFICIIIAGLALAACKKDMEIMAIKEVEYHDISYGPSAFQTLDIRLPANRSTKTPVIFLVHGGAWIEGNKSEMEHFSKSFLHEGYATVSINYRLANDSITYREINEDLRQAILFVEDKAEELYVSRHKSVIMGYSAGGQLALLHTFRNDPDKHIKAVVALSAPGDFCNPVYPGSYLNNCLEKYNGCTYSGNPLLWQQNSPLYAINHLAPPVYLIHGINDTYVDITDSRRQHQKLDSVGVENVLVEPALNHAGTLYLPDKEYTDLVRWLKQIIK